MLPAAELNDPAGQTEQAVASESRASGSKLSVPSEPTAQSEQLAEPAALNEPSGHAEQALALSERTTEPSVPSVLAGQLVQEMAPEAEYEPSVQLSQSALARAELKEPATQVEQAAT